MKFLSFISIFFVLLAFSPLQGQKSGSGGITLSFEAEAAIAGGNEAALAKAIEVFIDGAVADVAPGDVDAIVARASAAVATAVVRVAAESGARAQAIISRVQVAAEATFRAASNAGVSSAAKVDVMDQFIVGAETAATEANLRINIAEVVAEVIFKERFWMPMLSEPVITDPDIIVVSPEA